MIQGHPPQWIHRKGQYAVRGDAYKSFGEYNTLDQVENKLPGFSECNDGDSKETRGCRESMFNVAIFC